MSTRYCAVTAAVLLACAAAVLAPAPADAQVTGKDKIGMPGGGCERDFAARPGETGAAAVGGCDDTMMNDGTRGAARRAVRPAAPAADKPATSASRPKADQKKKSE
jgi:hypothetical protein